MEIEVRQTCIVIHGYELGYSPYIERIFSVFDKVRHSFVTYGSYYDKDKKDLYLPRGLDLFYIYKSFPNLKPFYKIHCDEYERIEPVKLKTMPRDDTQLTAIEFCLGIDPFKENRERSQLSLNLNTGKGKTYVAIAVVAYYSVKTIMIASSIDWLKQWEDKILEYTNIKKDEIYTIAGAASIMKLQSGFKDKDKIKFYLCSHDTLSAYAKKNGWESIRTLFQYLKIGIKIYDEAHLYFNNILMIDFFTDVWKTYYLTATPIKSDRYEDRVYKQSYKTVPKISLFDEENDPHTDYIAIKFNSHPTPLEVSKINSGPYKFNRMAYMNYLVHKENFFKITTVVVNEALKTLRPGGKILVYIGTNEAIMIIYYYLVYTFPNVSIGTFSALVSKDKKKGELDNTIILTTTKSAGAALDIKGLQVTIVLNEPFSSPVLARQTLGRTRDDDTLYIDVVDTGFNQLIKFYNKRKFIFNTYAKSRDEVIYQDYMIDKEIESMYRDRANFIPNKPLKQIVTFKEGY